ncbi:hypothetical protein P5673_028365 [Acropora cervicornis]|uniref:Reverse transcriptase domain-containing protein n=1 Tax=Acropora cervicornis TaxID=6130 RepID=A0AAD9UV77_ACRCE|nr:hypothetical protein P5673_028365 [Acropora cervicornis]
MLPAYQSAYRHHQSTETALLKVENDILLNMDNQRVNLLRLLDLSAAFDTVDYGTLLQRLKTSFGIQGKALKGLAPTYVASLILTKSPPRYNLRSSRDSLLLSCPKKMSKVTLGDRSFTYAALKLWNALPLDTRSESTVAGFKTKLKTHLFGEAFS